MAGRWVCGRVALQVLLAPAAEAGDDDDHRRFHRVAKERADRLARASGS